MTCYVYLTNLLYVLTHLPCLVASKRVVVHDLLHKGEFRLVAIGTPEVDLRVEEPALFLEYGDALQCYACRPCTVEQKRVEKLLCVWPYARSHVWSHV